MLHKSESESPNEHMEIATLGGGCFWCLDPLFNDLIGVQKVEVGYAGGRNKNPTYQQVCTGTTGHAEVVQITFDPRQITFEELLKIFFIYHDPTTLNRQGADIGTQYRSIILYHDENQKDVAKHVINSINQEKIWDRPVVTQLEPFIIFYKAEEYHQDYFARNPGQGYCRVVIAPKVTKFRQKYSQKLKSSK
jgi:peptide-methionine (S)-S-oxide reductase